MASPLFFFPDVQSTELADIWYQVGLNDLDSEVPTAVTTEDGPFGKSGTLAAYLDGGPKDPHLINSPLINWLEFPEAELRPGESVYVGIDPTRPLTPECVARKSQYQGSYITLNDENQWLIPHAQDLPKKLKLGKNRQVECIIEDRFQRYYDLAQRAMKEVFEPFGLWMAGGIDLSDQSKITDEIKTITIQDGVELAGMALNINYRMNFELATLLGLFSNRLIGGVISCAFSLPDIVATEEDLKKKEELVGIPVGSLIGAG